MLLGGREAEVHFFGTAIGSKLDLVKVAFLCAGARLGPDCVARGQARAQALVRKWASVIAAVAEEALAVETALEHPEAELDDPGQYGLPIRKLSGGRIEFLVSQARWKSGASLR
jgi:hypothetical protein